MQQMTPSQEITANPNRPPTEANNGGSTFEQVKTTVADKLVEAADALRQKTGQDSPTAAYATQASDWLHQAADYVRDFDPAELKSGIQRQVHNNPGRSLIAAAGIGLALGILLRRR
ncbi:MAG TPA: hypothetical protein VIS78_04070 [Blastocatellia bacterium]